MAAMTTSPAGTVAELWMDSAGSGQRARSGRFMLPVVTEQTSND